ncbi:hypothetical protein QAD02_016478 [Eretmocerus hayati]|uniref:Uncharacterized protein n=1 Tax=Eretmocerus hayati TaxID=131215 RepID=A0ACC2PB68_9HYME|nr:hypothetical protein QAD02_016478 [Eretmocerus hayati]
MADKIKSFFQKKVKDQKFKHAGKGHKLTESSSSQQASTSHGKDAPKRQEPTSDARVAGQAALARLEGMKTNTPKLNISYASIQAQAKKELEQEKQALARQAAEKSSGSTDQPGSSKLISEPKLLAVSGVFHRCPLISEEVLDKEAWFDKIQDFLSAQLSDDEAGLSACLIIHSCNDGAERINNCVKTLCKYLENICNEPNEPKYWKIRMSNKVFQEKVKGLRGTKELLEAAGFNKEKLMHQDQEEDFLVWSPERSNIDSLTTLIDALNSSESVSLILDRNTQVLLPSQAAQRSELPAEFYKLTPEELKREQFERTKAKEQNEMLMTQAMREKLMKDKERKYKYTLIRIRFPDNIILQGTFAVDEKYEDVLNFVREHLLTEEFSFHLITATREKLSIADSDKTLESLNLVPAVILTFFWDSSGNTEVPVHYLKEETLSLLQNV